MSDHNGEHDIDAAYETWQRQQDGERATCYTDEPRVNRPAPELVFMSDVQPERINWLWSNRIARGKSTLLIGDPGLGKSLVTLDVAARVTTGAAWPDDPIGCGPQVGNVILMSAEDGLADTLRPRLDKAGADVSRVVALEGVRTVDGKGEASVNPFDLTRDVERLREAIERVGGVSLVIIDPISAYLGQTDSHNNSEVRGVLTPLAKLAEDTGAALLLVSHLNKGSGSKAVYRATGSLAFPAAARTVWAVVEDQADPERRLMLPVKNNLAPFGGGLAFRVGTGSVEWEQGAVMMRADEALEEPEKKSKCEGAQEWLAELLADGGRPVEVIKSEAKAAELAWATVRRAQQALGIKPTRQGFGGSGGWYWSLPPTCSKVSTLAPAPKT